MPLVVGKRKKDLESEYVQELRQTRESLSDDCAAGAFESGHCSNSVGGAKSPPPPCEALQRLKDAFAQRLHGLDTDVLDVVVGAILANRIQGDPVWLFVIGPPGDGKSEVLRAFSGHNSVYPLSSISPNALISGYEGEGLEDPSLLPRLDGKVLIIKDFTTILDLPADARTQILGTLRDAYDGEAAKAFGSVGTRRYESRFGLIAGVTQAIDEYWSVSGQLGERFLKLRLKGGNRLEKVRRAVENVNTEDPFRIELREACHAVLDQVSETPILDEDVPVQIVALAEFVAIARSPVNRDRDGVLKGIPSPEIGTRVAKTLMKLAMGVAMARQGSRVGPYELRIIKRVGLDSVPPIRSELIRSLWDHGDLFRSGTKIATELGMPTGSATRHLEDLLLLKVAERSGNPQGGYHWRMTNDFREILEQAGVFCDTSEEDGEGGIPPPPQNPISRK